jgi:pimeloyl-ACP methyl ester carboxylesterase
MAQIDVIEERSYAPVELLKLDDCGHAPHLEQSEQVLAAISDFAARLVRIEAAEVVLA